MANYEEINPWTTLSQKEVYENKWIKVTEYQVLNPAGNEGIYGIVHFQNYAIGVIPYQDGCIWMVGQYRYPLKNYSWEIPEGGGSKENTPLESAMRELKEETGMTADVYTPIVEMHLSNSVTDEWCLIYLATGLHEGEAEPEETEELRIKKVKLEEAFAEVEAGKITDSLTVTAIYKLMLMKMKGELE
ncbi:MAG: NUDIX domain-containing protein [Bacteroidia bacterium]